MKKIVKRIVILAAVVLLILIFYWFLIRTIIAKSDFKKTVKCLNTGDFSEDFYYADSEGVVQEYLDTNKAGYILLQNTTFDVLDYDFHWNSKVAEVSVQADYPDVIIELQKRLNDADSLYTSDEMSDVLIDILNITTLQRLSDSFQITIVQNGWHWYLIENESLMNVYSGGILNELKESLNKDASNTEYNRSAEENGNSNNSDTETQMNVSTSGSIGDANFDNLIGIDDAQLALNAYVDIMSGKESTLTAEQLKAADVNGDNAVSVEDAQFILIYYVQNIVADMPTTWGELFK